VAWVSRGHRPVIGTASGGRLAWTGLLALVLVALALGAVAAVGQPAPVDAAPAVAPVAAAPWVPAVQVAVDIIPGLCPNHLRIDSPLTIPVGILGTADLEVDAIEPGTVRLSREGDSVAVAPLDYAYKDVGSPLIGGRCECRELVGDGLEDLVFYFDIKALGAALGLAGSVGETVPLILSGKLVTGRTISGVDCALVIDAGWADDRLERELGFLPDAGGQQPDGHFKFAYFSDVSDHMALTIYDLQGRAIACLVDMDLGPGIYNATWDGTGADKQRVAAGTYFARVSNSRSGETLKIDISHQ
jgi:hypothetical protein